MFHVHVARTKFESRGIMFFSVNFFDSYKHHVAITMHRAFINQNQLFIMTAESVFSEWKAWSHYIHKRHILKFWILFVVYAKEKFFWCKYYRKGEFTKKIKCYLFIIMMNYIIIIVIMHYWERSTFHPAALCY